MYPIYSKGLEEVLKELKLIPIEFEELVDKLSKEEENILEVIITRNTKAEWRLYIKEMCKYLNKNGRLPNEYKRLL